MVSLHQVWYSCLSAVLYLTVVAFSIAMVTIPMHVVFWFIGSGLLEGPAVTVEKIVLYPVKSCAAFEVRY